MPRKKGFTLIELLVVIAIIAILAAILFPVFLTAKAAAAKSKCLNNAKQIAQACIMYEGDYNGGMLPGFITKVGQSDIWGQWYDGINAYLKQMNKTSDTSFELRGIYMCPSIPRSVYTSNGREIDSNLKRCYGLNYRYLGGYPNTRYPGGYEVHNTSEMVKPTTTIRILETWNFEKVGETSKGWGTAYCYPPVTMANLSTPNRCWPPGWHGGASVVGWCDGHVSWTTTAKPRPGGPAGTDADYQGVMQKYYRGGSAAGQEDPYFRLGHPKP